MAQDCPEYGAVVCRRYKEWCKLGEGETGIKPNSPKMEMEDVP